MSRIPLQKTCDYIYEGWEGRDRNNSEVPHSVTSHENINRVKGRSTFLLHKRTKRQFLQNVFIWGHTLGDNGPNPITYVFQQNANTINLRGILSISCCVWSHMNQFTLANAYTTFLTCGNSVLRLTPIVLCPCRNAIGFWSLFLI